MSDIAKNLLLASGAVQEPEIGVDWRIKPSLPGSILFYSTGLSKYVIAGSVSGFDNNYGLVYTSPDLVSIEGPKLSLVNKEILDGIWADSKAILVSYTGGIYVSSDLENWINYSPTGNYYSISHSGGLYVITGASGAISTSTDNVNWTTRTSGTTDLLNKVIWTGTRFVAIKFYEQGVLTSTNGTTWSSAGTFSNYVNDIVWTGTQYVAVGIDGYIATSTDLSTWTTRTSGTSSILNSIYWDGTQYIAVGEQGTIITSSNATTWTVRTSNTKASLTKVIKSGATYNVLGYGSTLLTSSDGSSWSSVGSGATSSAYSLKWVSDRYVAATQNPYILDSTTGENFTIKADTGSSSIYLYTVTKVGSTYIAVGEDISGFATFTSTDLSTWTKRTSETAQIKYLSNNGTIVVAVGVGGSVRTTSDGITWTTRTSSTTQDLNDIIWTGSQFIAVGNNGTIITSSNGTTWTSRTSGTADQLLGIAWSGSRYVAVSVNGTFTSTDSVSWSSGSFDAWGQSVIWVNSFFIAVDYNLSIFKSIDGLTWEEVTPLSVTNNQPIPHALQAIGSNLSNIVIISSAGLILSP